MPGELIRARDPVCLTTSDTLHALPSIRARVLQSHGRPTRLADPDLASLYNEPLRHEPDERWGRRALAALDAGMSASEIAELALTDAGIIRGPFSKHFGNRAKQFQSLSQVIGDKRIVEIANVGERLCNAERDRAIERERREEAFGLD